MPASQFPEPEAPVRVGLITSIPKLMSVLVPGPEELLVTVTVNIALVVVHAVSSKSTVADRVAPSCVVEYRIEPVSLTLPKSRVEAFAPFQRQLVTMKATAIEPDLICVSICRRPLATVQPREHDPC